MKRIFWKFYDPAPKEPGAKADEVTAKSIMDKIESMKSELSVETSKNFNEKMAVMQATIDELKSRDSFKPEELAEMKQELDATIKALDIVQTRMKTNSTTTESKKSFSESLLEAFDVKEIKDSIAQIIKDNGKQNGSLIVKAAIDMGALNTIGSGSTHVNLTSNTGIISPLRKRMLTYLAAISLFPLNPELPYANWVEETDEQGTPIFIGEQTGATQLSVKYVEKEMRAKEIAVYGKITLNMLQFLPQLAAYIQNNLMKRVDIAVEDQLFNGDGTGENLKGILGYATTFDGGKGTKNGDGLVGLVLNPTNADVIRAIALQVQNSYGQPSVIFVDTDKMAQMDVEKDSEGHYNIPPFRTADGTQVAGIRLIPTTALAGTNYDFVGGDLSAVNVGYTNNMTITIGLDGNDFTNRKKTILLTQQLVQFVSANDTQVLVKGTFSDAKTLITQSVVPSA